MRLIDSDRALKIVDKEAEKILNAGYSKDNYITYSALLKFSEILRFTPTVDAIPVIRCKDCIHCSSRTTCGECDLIETYGEDENYVDFNDYCSRAERK